MDLRYRRTDVDENGSYDDDERTNEQTNRRTKEQTYKQMNIQTNIQTNERKNGSAHLRRVFIRFFAKNKKNFTLTE